MDSIAKFKEYKEEKKLSKKPVVKKKVVKVVKKKKTKTRWQLIKEFDAIFSRYIRQRDSIDWICTCITCWDKHPIEKMHNTHFITRWNYKYRRDENNCFAWCYKCNIILHWNYINYTLAMISKFWKEKVEQMINDKELIKISTPEIREKIEYYKSLLKK